MEKKNIKNKLDETLERLGIKNPSDWHEHIEILKRKLEFLNDLKRYDGLLKNFFSSGDKSGFNSFAFEASFAYDFESNGHHLDYEIRNLSESMTSVDYCFESDGKSFYFELKVINEKDAVTSSIEEQLRGFGFYEIIQGGEEEQTEITRIQNLVLSKCQYKGDPIKFEAGKGAYNFIVVFVSALQLGMIDKADCILTMYGDRSVPIHCRRGVFGLCQELTKDASEAQVRYSEKFAHFRKTIHGVLFVKDVSVGGDSNYFVNLDLQYFFIGNNAIFKDEDCTDLNKKIAFLPSWTDRK